jgi:hypothetical protein
MTEMTDNFEGVNHLEEKIFESYRNVTKPDGWITPAGVYYACNPPEHDDCAKYILKTHSGLIDSLLEKNGRYGMIGHDSSFPPREILKAAGFALLSDGLLVDSNLPESLTLKQLEFNNRNHLEFINKGNQLELSDYQAFLEKIKNYDEIKETITFNERNVRKFMEDPTYAIYFEEDQYGADIVFDVLTKNHTAEISLEVGKGKITWRRIDIDTINVFVEKNFHDHGYEDTYPETETWISLTTKQNIEDAIAKYKKSRGYRPQGDLTILN